jgi:hypothetical protein
MTPAYNIEDPGDSLAVCTGTSTSSRDENGSDTNGYNKYHICFHIFVRIQIRIRIVSDRIQLDIDIINIRFEYSDMNMVSDVEYPDSDTDGSRPL